MPSHMLPKPAKGTARKMQQARRRRIETKERAAKDAAKARDGYLCRCCHIPQHRYVIEAAHIRSGHVRLTAGVKGGDGLVRFVDVKKPGHV